MSKKKVLFNIILTILFSICLKIEASACTTVYVGKDVSEDGATIIARSVEWIPGYMSYVDSYDAKGHKKGDYIEDYMSGFKYEYPKKTFKYILGSTMDYAGDGKTTDVCMDEYGLTVSATISADTNEKAIKADPHVEDGISEGSISLILGSCCKNARDAVVLLCNIVDEYGSANPNSLIIADQKETWYVELYTGHQYAAIKMPEDKAAVIGNQFILGSFDIKDKDVYYSKDLINLAKKNKFAVFEKNGCINLFKTYANGINAYTYPRVWKGQQLLAADKPSGYDPDEEYPAFFKPDGKVSFEDVAKFYRTEYDEDDEFDIEDGKQIYPISLSSINSVHIVEIYDNLPAEMSSVLWLCNAPSKYGQFVPISNMVDEIPESYSANFAEREYVKGVAACEFYRLSGICIADPDYTGKKVVAYNTGMEKANKYAFDKHMKEWNSKYKRNPSGVKKTITQYCASIMEESVEDAQSLFDEASWYLESQVYPRYVIEDKKAFRLDYSAKATFMLYFDVERLANKYDWEIKHDDKELTATKDGKTITIDLDDEELYKNEQIDWKTGEVLYTEEKEKIQNYKGFIEHVHNIILSDENSDKEKLYASYVNYKGGRVLVFVNMISIFEQ